jgi:copper oxidase (laccase) domain-containing protein
MDPRRQVEPQVQSASPAVVEQAGFAGSLPAIRILGLGESVEAGLTTVESNFRYCDVAADEGVARAYAALAAYAALFGGWLRVEQVHGARVVSADLPDRLHGPADRQDFPNVRFDQAQTGLRLGNLPGPGVVPTLPGGGAAPGRTLGQADGILFQESAEASTPRLLTVTVADCVPVYMLWPGGYGLLHAGWRGVAAGLLETALEASGVAPERIRLHLGPAIGGCCYEVGPEVIDAIHAGRRAPAAGAPERAVQPGRAGRLMLDLRGVLAGRARAAGVAAENVTSSPSCTSCRGSFHSLRRSGQRTPRQLMLAFIGARP